jgi:hypothetical protein
MVAGSNPARGAKPNQIVSSDLALRSLGTKALLHTPRTPAGKFSEATRLPPDFARHNTRLHGLPMTETSDIGSLVKHRRGVAPGTLLLWIVLAAVGGAIVWGIYGNDVRSALRLPPAGAPTHWVGTQNSPSPPTTNLNEVVGLVKDLQASQERTANDVRTALQLLTSEQAATRTLSDAVAALQAKVDTLQRPVAPAVKPPAPVAARKPPAAARPAPDTTEPEQPDLEPPPGAPAKLLPR